ncbi:MULTISPECIES: hypothetical protein [unclassified Bartonella]
MLLVEKTNASYRSSESILDHMVSGKIECAYSRTDYLEQRRILWLK